MKTTEYTQRTEKERGRPETADLEGNSRDATVRLMEPHGPTGGSPPDPPPVPAPIDRRRLWWSLLLPQAFPVLGALIELVIGISGGGSNGTALVIGLVLFAIFGLICWVMFGQIISARFRGSGVVLMVLAYPIAQIIVMVTLLFACCLALLASGA